MVGFVFVGVDRSLRLSLIGPTDSMIGPTDSKQKQPPHA
jgi:hypothetical protein